MPLIGGFITAARDFISGRLQVICTPFKCLVEEEQRLSMSVLQGSPLVLEDMSMDSGSPVVVSDLDAKGERAVISTAANEASASLNLSFKQLTLDSLGASLITQPNILHISGHGAFLPSGKYALALEKESGSADLFTTDSLAKLLDSSYDCQTEAPTPVVAPVKQLGAVTTVGIDSALKDKASSTRNASSKKGLTGRVKISTATKAAKVSKKAQKRSQIARVPKLVFLGACYSAHAGRLFVEAGVPHVIAVKSNERVLDTSTRLFARFFYSALFNGHSVKRSFEIASANVDVAIDAQHEAKLQQMHQYQQQQLKLQQHQLPAAAELKESLPGSANSSSSDDKSNTSANDSKIMNANSTALLKPLPTLRCSVHRQSCCESSLLSSKPESTKFILLPVFGDHDVVLFPKSAPGALNCLLPALCSSTTPVSSVSDQDNCEAEHQLQQAPAVSRTSSSDLFSPEIKIIDASSLLLASPKSTSSTSSLNSVHKPLTTSSADLSSPAVQTLSDSGPSTISIDASSASSNSNAAIEAILGAAQQPGSPSLSPRLSPQSNNSASEFDANASSSSSASNNSNSNNSDGGVCSNLCISLPPPLPPSSPNANLSPRCGSPVTSAAETKHRSSPPTTTSSKHSRTGSTGSPRVQLQQPATVRNSVPGMPEHFVGRQVDVHKTVGLLRNHRCVNLFGPKQYGKTAVSIAAAHYMLDRPQNFFRDGIFFMSLSRNTVDKWLDSAVTAAKSKESKITSNTTDNAASSLGLNKPTSPTSTIAEFKTVSLTDSPVNVLFTKQALEQQQARNAVIMQSPQQDDVESMLNLTEAKLVGELCAAMRITQPIKTLAELCEMVASWDALLIFDDCGHPFANALVLYLLKNTHKLRLVLTTHNHSAIYLPIDSGFAKALVCVKELANDASVQLLRRLIPGISPQDASAIMQQARGSPYQLRLHAESLNRAKANKLAARLPQ